MAILLPNECLIESLPDDVLQHDNYIFCANITLTDTQVALLFNGCRDHPGQLGWAQSWQFYEVRLSSTERRKLEVCLHRRLGSGHHSDATSVQHRFQDHPVCLCEASTSFQTQEVARAFCHAHLHGLGILELTQRAQRSQMFFFCYQLLFAIIAKATGWTLHPDWFVRTVHLLCHNSYVAPGQQSTAIFRVILRSQMDTGTNPHSSSGRVAREQCEEASDELSSKALANTEMSTDQNMSMGLLAFFQYVPARSISEPLHNELLDKFQAHCAIKLCFELRVELNLLPGPQ
mmetsp:Transcript_48885/g.89609  ORF Transcript_48885/g.89609 Transcript_48885/m.89609 type:complete len:289 (+) Transcript_48885:331-1197(+)